MPSENSRDKLVSQFVYTGVFSITEAADSLSASLYREYFRPELARSRPISLTPIDDLMLRRRICEYLVCSIDENSILPYSYSCYRLNPVRNILSIAPDYFALSYKAFLEKISEIPSRVNVNLICLNNFVHCFQKYCLLKEHSNDLFSLDFWPLDHFHLSYDRNYSFRLKQLNFDRFNNETNKYLVKKYAEHQLTNTGLSVTHIYKSVIELRIVLNMVDKAYLDWSQDDALIFAERIQKRYSRPSTIACTMITFFAFTDYLLIHDYLSDNPIKKLRSLARTGFSFQHSAKAVDNYVISQIYSALDRMKDPKTKLGFLILHSVGMRCSEMLALKRNCIETRNESAFLRYYSPKMKKDVCNVIPLSLAELILEYEKTLSPGEYLFPSTLKRDFHISYTYFQSHFNSFLEENNILSSDGTPYHFSSHSMRHLMAVRMRENNVPLKYIQEQLHHSNIDMTLAYVEYLDRVKLKKMGLYLDAKGDKTDFAPPEIDSDQSTYLDYMRKRINAQILPNGICARPVILGKCPHGNCCLDCPDFRTSKQNLEEHRRHLQRVEFYIEMAEQNGWLPQAESNRETKHKLQRIITELEAIPDELAAD